MIAALIGATFTVSGIITGWTAIYGHLGPAATVVLIFCSAWWLLGGGLISALVASRAFGRWRDRQCRKPEPAEGEPSDAEINRMIRNYRERNDRG